MICIIKFFFLSLRQRLIVIIMGIYLNPNNKGFKGFLNKKIYIDKTMLISALFH